MRGIVVGVDGSSHSQRALEWAMKEAAVRDVPLTIMTVHELIRGYFGGLASYPNDEVLAKQAGDVVQAEVDRTLAALGEPCPRTVTVRIVSGSVVEELLSAAEDADMLVVGSRGAGTFSRLLLGSVSSLVVQHAVGPVVIVPPPEDSEHPAWGE
jgi:nucleotide-binding universal stress UspA family protein